MNDYYPAVSFDLKDTNDLYLSTNLRIRRNEIWYTIPIVLNVDIRDCKNNPYEQLLILMIKMAYKYQHLYKIMGTDKEDVLQVSEEERLRT